MEECCKPKTSDEIQKASEEYIFRTHIDNASVQDHFIAGAEWMQKQLQEDNEGQALLYAVEKTAERTKREMIEKIAEWMRNFKDGQGNFPLYDYVGNFKQAMEE